MGPSRTRGGEAEKKQACDSPPAHHQATEMKFKGPANQQKGPLNHSRGLLR